MNLEFETFRKNPALFTDDTQMSIAIAEALITAGDRDIDTIMAAVRDEFITWRHSPENNRAPGNTCLVGVKNMERGAHWSESGVADSKGCGSAMRVAPIGYFYQNDPERLKAVARASGICTKGRNCRCGYYQGRLSHSGSLKVEKNLGCNDEEKALHYLGEGWVGKEAVALALYCFLKYPDDYEKTVLI